jgi:hypothetical protein
MSTKRVVYAAMILATFMLGGILQPLSNRSTFAQDQCQTFKETGKWVCGRFLAYWQNNGGVAQQGYPISDEFQEVSDLDGKTYTVQYFERAEFEYHPENQPPNDVLLSQLGTFQYRRKYPNGDPTNVEAQVSLPSETVEQYFTDMAYDGGVSEMAQRSLLSKHLLDHLAGADPYYGLVGNNFSEPTTFQDAPRTDFSGNGPVWVLLLDQKGTTVGVFTLVKEGGNWKIDYVEPNVLTH